jgi:hypothetical protein
MAKKVRITIEMDSSFVTQLKLNCTFQKLGNLREDYRQHTAMQVLGLVAMLEGMGATPEQIDAEIPHEWRNNICVVSEERKVMEV